MTGGILSLLFYEERSVAQYKKSVSRLLEETIGRLFACPDDFAQGARQGRYKMLQVADLICATELINRRLEDGQPFPLAEKRFFGGARDFKRNLLKKIRQKAFVTKRGLSP